MTTPVRIARGALAALTLVAAAAACGDDDVDIVDPSFQGGELFRSYVAVGNSITAGFQSSGINDSTQRESYAYLFAQQLYGSDVARRWSYPSLVAPGCPAPVANIQTGVRVGGSAAAGCNLRNSAAVGYQLNNVAVPNAFVVDPTSQTTANSNTLTTVILGGSTQVSRALQARPTFVSVWIGNNDALAAASTGLLARTTQGTGATAPGVSPGITATARSSRATSA
jgi:hypothetical protein